MFQCAPNNRKSDDLPFEPTVEMMVHDFDDEQTLEEEERLAASEAQDERAELSNLEKEQDLSIEELMDMYGYSSDLPKTSKKPEKLLLQNQEQNSSRLLRLSRARSEECDDFEYSPDEDERKKTIMVGSDFQATIPEGLSNYDDALPYENKDKLLWDPNLLSEAQTIEFLGKITRSKEANYLPMGSHLRDDEQSLFLLLQCGFNTEEALRRKKISLISAEEATVWSEEECRNFENGLRNYGKDFYMIQQNKVRTRSVGELVQFYYLWKKTERHDVFASKTRLEKKKYSLHPGVTDFMDRFLEEDDLSRDRSSSPNFPINVIQDNRKMGNVTRYGIL